jgi:hypothetical protein
MSNRTPTWDWKCTAYPPVELKCLSEKRRREIAALVGDQGSVALRLDYPDECSKL